MKRTPTTLLGIVFLLLSIASLGQPAPTPAATAPNPGQGGPSAQGEPVSYASVSELNTMLSNLETTSKQAQTDLTRLRIERWKTDNGTKKQILANVDSIQRNLQDALPEIIGKLRAAPGDVPPTFRLYRNLDALYDVLGNVVEATGAFGSKDDFQALTNDLSSFEETRKGIAGRIETLASSKEAEIVRLRTELKTAEAEIPATPPKKIVIDDTQPQKKPAPAKKKKPAKPAGTPTQPPPGQTQNPQP